MDAIFLDIYSLLQLKGFEYRVFYGSWKNSRLMGFEHIRDNVGYIF